MEMALKYEKREHDQFSDTTPVLLEMAIWQTPIKLQSPCEILQKEVSNNLSAVVEGMQKPYIVYNIYELEKSSVSNPILLDAIGVQCNSSFILGTATLDGLRERIPLSPGKSLFRVPVLLPFLSQQLFQKSFEVQLPRP